MLIVIFFVYYILILLCLLYSLGGLRSEFCYITIGVGSVMGLVTRGVSVSTNSRLFTTPGLPGFRGL